MFKGCWRNQKQNEDEVSPHDSVSQVGADKSGEKSNGKGVCVPSGERLMSRISAVGRRAESVVSAVSRTSRVTNVSALERRRIIEVEMEVFETQKRKKAHIEKMKDRQWIAKLRANRELEEEKVKLERELERRRKLRQEKEEYEELRIAEEIRNLEREAKEEALKVEAAAWRRFEEMDRSVHQVGGRLDGPNENASREAGCREKSLNAKGFIGELGVSNCGELPNFVSKKVGQHVEKNAEKEQSVYGGVQVDEMKGERTYGFLNDKVGRKRVGVSVEMEDMRFDRQFVRELTASNMRNCMPKHEIEKFDGDVSKYSIFKGAMREISQSKVISCEEKLHYVYQFTTGEPRELVTAALHMKPEDGFTELWRWYEEKYGAPELVGAGFMNKLMARSPVARDDVEGLKAYAVALRLTMNVMANIPSGKAELEHPKTVRRLVSKLTYNLQERWRTMSADSKYDKGIYLGFENLVKFVERTARIDSDPLFGKDVMQRSTTDFGDRSTNKRRILPINMMTSKDFRTDTTKSVAEQYNGSPDCVICNGPHTVKNCEAFLRLTPDQRWETVRGKGLCFICLEVGHRANACSRPVTCKSCGRYHNDLLHAQNKKGRFGASSFDR